MIRTEWLNMSVARLRRRFGNRCNCDLARHLVDFRDTAAEAEQRGHRTRTEYLHRLIRRGEAGCIAPLSQRRGA